MCPGISAKILPLRGNCAAVKHCLISFHHAILPSSALLGEIQVSIPPRLHFLRAILRVAVGTLALTSITIAGLAISSHIALRYSMRGVVQSNGELVPIFSFRTQQIPILNTIAQGAFHQHTIKLFVDEEISPFVRHGVATAFKAVVIRDVLASHAVLPERCGAIGLFIMNQLILHHVRFPIIYGIRSKLTSLQDEMRGVAIAAGNVFVLSIRFATELLLDRYCMPPQADPHSLLGLHDDGLVKEYRSVILNNGGHRSAKFASRVLPHCEDLVRTIGYRIAYTMLQLRPTCRKAWLISVATTCRQMGDRYASRIYVTAPVVSDAAWRAFESRLEEFNNKIGAKL
ncbi:hypothetical protein DFH08DRAFT_825133 [Mycena albidolilacea]|uniref:Uncharacterized protein n=1 Tax=Mycena albidolilacea TaxID=1033008 RepID=A0AAD6Z2P8_9AGAR|nr:hypothetical protein DFH08DRAFT_825133 [Mycena albidolilacea]